ncbi:uncharacterized protein LOC110179739 [Drosophila serrata]|uniref:uncharacterized protein LOC110179739 n=1 Tax=Drosophila serrata TaxID=7274 RepID=UPI000A1D26AB|nr:uncharacterized protein LOC110179739 [Drosophila serrata]
MSGRAPVQAPIGQVNPNYNLDNERLDCERIDEITTIYSYIERPSFVTVLLRFFGNMFVDIFRAIFY